MPAGCLHNSVEQVSTHAKFCASKITSFLMKHNLFGIFCDDVQVYRPSIPEVNALITALEVKLETPLWLSK